MKTKITILKSTITKLKVLLEVFKGRLEQEEERINIKIGEQKLTGTGIESKKIKEKLTAKDTCGTQ